MKARKGTILYLAFAATSVMALMIGQTLAGNYETAQILFAIWLLFLLHAVALE